MTRLVGGVSSPGVVLVVPPGVGGGGGGVRRSIYPGSSSYGIVGGQPMMIKSVCVRACPDYSRYSSEVKLPRKVRVAASMS